jgi:hypothetical protein
VLAGLIGVPATMLLGIVVERVALTRSTTATTSIRCWPHSGSSCSSEVVRIIWGPASVYMNTPEALSGTVSLFCAYPRTASRSLA